MEIGSLGDDLKARIGLSGPPLTRVPSAAPAIPDHEMVRCIGQGSYGEVWLARNAAGTFRAVEVVYRARFSGKEIFLGPYSLLTDISIVVI
jgi:hypothetical protein